jgi:hypothetical protein
MRLPDHVFQTTYEISPTGLSVPASYSRLEKRVASFRELLVSRFSENAIILGLTDPQSDPPLPRVSELSLEELQAITLATYTHSRRGYADNGHSIKYLRDHVTRATSDGHTFMNMRRRVMEHHEQIAERGLWRLIPDPRS